MTSHVVRPAHCAKANLSAPGVRWGNRPNRVFLCAAFMPCCDDKPRLIVSLVRESQAASSPHRMTGIFGKRRLLTLREQEFPTSVAALCLQFGQRTKRFPAG
ncbi:uncharacterized protein PGTG_16231 [Puccinia graminis f. sp. tritici CRL 75-36-700-3]|uniref:Uncharacterized protein n=1 Tax=Puccinia graminis f. sp. tritici (strain CRL 75-36-700-3 / race SCCL) TaxID=418459 RepID=E3L056_PUCGT|nr:uncharacterized protein PGTG_16231 [Puccinia graminis f. sp. tritici CRL 75-36-700-3]EFP89943.1 hypothetical protein PGTG_16231 [Puccinia graminis f. sp. tritici CRL 75-36-700-3]